jgi:hypothetical protein
MATKSIIKNVYLKDKRLASQFVFALEKAETYSKKNPLKPVESNDVRGDRIREMFSKEA